MPTISSAQNPRIKQVRALLERRRERTRSELFVCEGEDLLEVALSHGIKPEYLLLSEAADSNTKELVQQLGSGGKTAGPGTEILTVEPGLMASTSSLGSGTRVIAVFKQQWATSATGPRCLCLWGVKDPGNVGTAIRSAHAFGASSVAIGPETVDPYGPKAVRASMGSIFARPPFKAHNVNELPGETIALVLRDGEALDGNAKWLDTAANGVTLIIGNERTGLPPETAAACHRRAHLPIAGAESLNAAMAATAALYELGRITAL